MAEKLCELRKKGGGGGSATWVETVLWQNPSPSSDFAAQTVTLSDDINNYDYLKVSYVNYNASAGTNDPYNIYISVSDFKTSRYGDSTRHNTFTFGGLYVPSNNWYTRQMVYNTDTSVKFGACTQVGGTAVSGNNSVPLQIVGISKGRVPSYKTVKDFIHAKVFDSGLPEISTYTVYSNRVTVTEGKVVADTVTHKVYMYFDFTTNSAFGSASDYSSILQFTSATVNYTPVYATNSRANNISLVTDDSSDVPAKQFAWGYCTTSVPYRLFLPYGATVNANEHYIVYAEYTYK